MTKQESQQVLDPVSTTLKAVEDAGLGSLAWMGSAWVEALSDIGSEALGFVAERVREDVKTQHELLHCKSIQEVQQVQAKYIQTALEQYTAETGKIIEKGTGIFGGSHEKRHATPV